MVDLPGYGYAKVPLATKQKWQEHLSEYLQKRECLSGLVLLMDIRHPLQNFDTMMLNWSVGANMPVHILLTKSDKLNRGVASKTLLEVQKHLRDAKVDDLVTAQTFSATSGEGLASLEQVLSGWLNLDAATDTDDQPETSPSKSL